MGEAVKSRTVYSEKKLKKTLDIEWIRVQVRRIETGMREIRPTVQHNVQNVCRRTLNIKVGILQECRVRIIARWIVVKFKFLSEFMIFRFYFCTKEISFP